MLPALICSFALVLLVLELRVPFRRPGGTASERLSRIAKNLGLAGLGAVVGRLLSIALAAVVARYGPVRRPAELSGDLGLAFDFVVLDLWIYGWHRVVHAWPLAWRFHQVHHLDQQVDMTTALRFHAGDVALSTVSRASVVLAIGVPLYHVFLFEAATVVASLFHHANVRLPPSVDRALSLVIVTPDFHRVHHNPLRDVHDSNYATILTVWDRVFGSCLSRGARVSLAADADALPGLVGRTDEGALALLAMPFREHGRSLSSSPLAGP